MSAPFVAQGLANGTGNVTGMLASFGAAGIAAGGVAGTWAAGKFNKGGAAAGSGMAKGANAAGGALNQKLGLTPPPQRSSMMPNIGSVRDGNMPSSGLTAKAPPSGGGPSGGGSGGPSGPKANSSHVEEKKRKGSGAETFFDVTWGTLRLWPLKQLPARVTRKRKCYAAKKRFSFCYPG